MNRCPSCKGELVEGSVICPHCGEILDTKNPFADLDNELERFSQMIFNMENDIDMEDSVPKYNPKDIDKILNGVEDTPEEVKEEPKAEPKAEEKIADAPAEDTENKSFSFTPSSFKASSSGVVKVDENSTDKKVEEKKLEDKTGETVSEIAEESSTQNESESAETDNSENNKEETESKEPVKEVPIEKQEVSAEDEELINALHSLSDYLDETLESENHLNTLFDEISKYAKEFAGEFEKGSIDFDNADIDDLTNIAIKPVENNIFMAVNSMDAFLQKESSVVNIDKKVLDFIEELKNTKGNERHVDNAKETYLKLNFVTTDKFATLISSENERIDTQTVVKTSDEEKERITDIFGIEAIVYAETLSEEELNLTIEAVNIQKDEIMHSLEMEEKELIVIRYKNLRKKMISGVKVGAIIIMICMSTYFVQQIFDVHPFSVETKLYSNNAIEKYDQYIYSSVLDIDNQIAIVNENFDKYQKGQLTDEEMLKVCEESSIILNKYKNVFDKRVYDEAEEYVFAANNGFFFASYYIENIITYINTGDNFYLQSNVIAVKQKEMILEKVYDERIDFLKELGYTDEEIQILNYKAGVEKK